MGLLSKIFGFGKSIGTKASFLGSYRAASGRSYSGGGWGLARFNSIVDAHSSVEDLIEEFSIDSEDSNYMSLNGYPNCYTEAYEQEKEKAEIEAEILEALGIEIDDIEELMDFDQIEQDAFDYAVDLVSAWLDGGEWVPQEIMDFAFYDLSDHNL